ncbi:hypothetical protein CDL15_Pgr009389 [Punica granatum]|uniref:Uncharacterized protein n=1 Tax=Punica granatum TaxID=22663 RepID=A0A218WV71_PUNGR|nr:hypothetical protein CDL15_Pgr009389 [Punica granatum]
MLTRASLLSCTLSSPSHLARASCNLAGSPNLCERTFLHRKFAEPPPSYLLLPSRIAEPPRPCLLQPCRVCSPVGIFFAASQVYGDTSLSPCKLAGSANPCELTFLHRKIAEPPRPCLLQPCRVCSPVGIFFAASQVYGDTSLSPCKLAGSANPCELTFLHRKIAEPPRPCLLQPCRVCSPVGIFFAASQVYGDTSLSPCKLAGSANPCELTFLHRKIAEPPRPCLLQPCRVCSPVGIFFAASQVYGDTSLSPCKLAGSANPCELTFLHRKIAEPPRPCLLQPCRVCSPVGIFFAASQVYGDTSLSPCKLAGSANPCELTFLHRKIAEPPRPCLLQPCRVCSPVGIFFAASQVYGDTSLSPCKLAGSANPCELTFLHRKFTEPPPSCLLQPCRAC